MIDLVGKLWDERVNGLRYMAVRGNFAHVIRVKVRELFENRVAVEKIGFPPGRVFRYPIRLLQYVGNVGNDAFDRLKRLGFAKPHVSEVLLAVL